MRRYDISLAKEDQKVIITCVPFFFSVADRFYFFLYSLRPEKGSFANPLNAKLVLSVAICNRRILIGNLHYLFLPPSYLAPVGLE